MKIAKVTRNDKRKRINEKEDDEAKEAKVQPYWKDAYEPCDSCHFLGTMKEAISGEVTDMWICIKETGMITTINQHGPNPGDYGQRMDEGFIPDEHTYIRYQAASQGLLKIEECGCGGDPIDHTISYIGTASDHRCRFCRNDLYYVKK